MLRACSTAMPVHPETTCHTPWDALTMVSTWIFIIFWSGMWVFRQKPWMFLRIPITSGTWESNAFSTKKKYFWTPHLTLHQTHHTQKLQVSAHSGRCITMFHHVSPQKHDAAPAPRPRGWPCGAPRWWRPTFQGVRPPGDFSNDGFKTVGHWWWNDGEMMVKCWLDNG